MTKPSHRRARAVDTNGEPTEVFRRLGDAEQQIGQLREQFVGFSAQLKHQDQQLSHIESQIGAIANSFQARNVTDWKTLAAWASVILAVVALYTNLNLAPLKEGIADGKSTTAAMRSEIKSVETAQVRSINELVSSAEMRGRAAERLDNIEERLKTEGVEK